MFKVSRFLAHCFGLFMLVGRIFGRVVMAFSVSGCVRWRHRPFLAQALGPIFLVRHRARRMRLVGGVRFTSCHFGLAAAIDCEFNHFALAWATFAYCLHWR